ncbi:MAG: futalosine hydrolase [Ferruginibacter sp.]
MQILVAAATELEIKPFVKNNPSADIHITGVGSPSAIYHLTKRIQLLDYDLVIQAGIAGSFLHEMKLGEVVIVSADTFSDLGIKTKNGFSDIFNEGLADKNEWPYKNGWLVNESEIFINLPYEKVRGVTVNTVTDQKLVISEMTLQFKPVIESMEGAALHYVCLQENVPFIQLRSISNYVGERDKSKWKMQEAIKNLNKELEIIIEKVKG